ncbi:MAG: hypothetical protein ABI655_06015 [Phenylobacterium sp.]
MESYDEAMDRLRAGAQQLIGRNALALAQHGAGPQSGPANPPEKQWWNIPAKLHAAERIKADVLRDYPGWNDAGDAARHAELSRRMASEIDPAFSHLAGVAHEVENTIPSSWVKFAPPFLQDHAKQNWHSQDRAERLMDDRNNAEGRAAAREHRPVDPARLQTSPNGPLPEGAPYRPMRR